MTTDKTPTPTDAEIVELLGDPRYSSIAAVREALARLGAQPAPADSVLEDAARLLESQHTWLTNIAAANLVRSLAARKQGGAT